MKYEVQLSKDGTIIHAQTLGSPWGNMEINTPDFHYEIMDLTEKQLNRLTGLYKKEDDKLINSKNNEEFDDELLFDNKDFKKTIKLFPNLEERENWCNSLDTDWRSKQESPCLFLNAWYTGFDPHTIEGNIKIRKYWFNKFTNFKKEEGMKHLLIYSLYGDYAMIGQCMNQLPLNTINLILNSTDVFTEEDKTYMTWLGKW